MQRSRWAPLALLAACLMIGVTASPAAAEPVRGSGPVVVVGVPDLRWQDVDPATTPTLWRLAGTSSVAALTVRSDEPTTPRATGWLTLDTGSRARADGDPATVPDPAVPAQLAQLRAANAAGSYRAQVGALGDALHRAGLTTAAAGGPGAVLGAMDGAGTVDTRAPELPAPLPGDDVVVVELPQLYGVDRQDPGAVRQALATIDRDVGTVLAQLPHGATLLLAGVSDAPAGPAALHVAMATGPSFGAGLLTSPSTGRDGVVQLIDVAPTVLGQAGAAVPAAMLGAPWHAIPGTGAPLAQVLSGFVDLDQRSQIQQAVVPWYYPAVAFTALLFVALTLAGWAWRRTRLLRPLGAVVAAVPVAGYLAQLVPWWRAGTWPLALLTAGCAAVLGLGAAAATRGRWGTTALVGGGTALVVVADTLAGSPLALDAPFADNPIIAGRFHGVGNVAFSLLGAGTLLLAAALANARPPRRAAAVVVGLGAVAVAVDGLPALGDDFGGVLALLPAVAVLALVVSRTRVAVRHVLAIAAAAVTATAAFALYDWSRPPAQRTHLGRFVGQLGDGTALTVVHRKLDTSLSTFTGGWARWILVGWVLLAVATWLAARAGRLRLAAGVDPRIAGGLLAALGVMAFLGAALNDSGAEIPAFAFYLAAPLLVPLAAPISAPPPAPSPAPSAAGSAGAVRS